MFNFIKEKLRKIYTHVSSGLQQLFGAQSIDESTLTKLKQILLSADTGVQTTNTIIAKLQQQYQAGTLQQGSDLAQALETILQDILLPTPQPQTPIFMLVGINGGGKTTFAGKLAKYLQNQTGKKCILAAADTFRAAAPEQLTQWAQRSDAQLFVGKPNQDPASVVFNAIVEYKKDPENSILIIDTAGRLQTKEHLMRELEKIKRVITKQIADTDICTLLTIDAMLGQNSFDQAKVFHEATNVSSIVLTKLDGTAKGGIVFAIADKLQLPVSFISFGEGIDDIKSFDPKTFVQELIQK